MFLLWHDICHSQQSISPIRFLLLKLPPPPCAVLLVLNVKPSRSRYIQIDHKTNSSTFMCRSRSSKIQGTQTLLGCQVFTLVDQPWSTLLILLAEAMLNVFHSWWDRASASQQQVKVEALHRHFRSWNTGAWSPRSEIHWNSMSNQWAIVPLQQKNPGNTQGTQQALRVASSVAVLPSATADRWFEHRNLCHLRCWGPSSAHGVEWLIWCDGNTNGWVLRRQRSIWK